MKTHTEHSIRIVEEEVPAGHVVIDDYTPTSSVTPWDYYGGKHQREYSAVLKAAVIQHTLLTTHRTNLAPMGTGPMGRVRFGDDMMPGTYRISVTVADQSAALAAIEKHKQGIKDWLDGKAEMPAACR